MSYKPLEELIEMSVIADISNLANLENTQESQETSRNYTDLNESAFDRAFDNWNNFLSKCFPIVCCWGTTCCPCLKITNNNFCDWCYASPDGSPIPRCSGFSACFVCYLCL